MKHITFLIALLATIMTWSCKSQPQQEFPWDPEDTLATIEDTIEEIIIPEEDCFKIPYTDVGGLKVIPVRVNGMPLDMIYDTGSTETMLSLAEAEYLYRKGLLTEADFIEEQSLSMADGSITEGLKIRLKQLAVGTDKNGFYIEDIEATVTGSHNSMLLLGQNVMQYFRSISVDTEEGVIKFYEK